jgi:hypothetical protein
MRARVLNSKFRQAGGGGAEGRVSEMGGGVGGTDGLFAYVRPIAPEARISYLFLFLFLFQFVCTCICFHEP